MQKMEDANAQKTADAVNAVDAVKDFFRKVKGAEIKVGKMELIDWLDFSVISAEPLDENRYHVICELRENLFSEKKERYDAKVIIKGVKGEVMSAKRISAKRIENEQV